MIVKKINPEWFPSEKKDLKVGETIEMTDPKELILKGDVVGLDKDGLEVSAYDLYGIIVQEEKREFEEYLKLRKAQALEKSLKAQQAELKEEMSKTATEVATKGESKTAGEVEKKMTWKEMTEKGLKLGVYKIGMKKVELEAALKGK